MCDVMLLRIVILLSLLVCMNNHLVTRYLNSSQYVLMMAHVMCRI